MFLVFQVSFIYLLFALSEAKRNLIYGNALASCTHKAPHLIDSYGCRLEIQTRRIYGYGHIMFKRRIKAMPLQVTIVRHDLNLGDINIVNLPMDLCEFLSHSKHNYLSFLVKPMRKYVNEIPRCPLKENFNYTVADAFLDAENVPDFVPVGNFTLTIHFFDKQINAGQFKLSSELKYKGKKANVECCLCNFLEQSQHKYFRRYVNEIQRCPLKKNFNYTLAEALVDAENMPDFIPVGNFRFIMKFFDQQTEAGHFILRSEIKYKGKRRKG